jgi:hypothetical protein
MNCTCKDVLTYYMVKQTGDNCTCKDVLTYYMLKQTGDDLHVVMIHMCRDILTM